MLCTILQVLYLSMLFPPLGLRKMAAQCQSPEGARSDPAKWLWYYVFGLTSCHSATPAEWIARVDYLLTEQWRTTAKRHDLRYKSLFLVKKIEDNGTQKAVQRQRMGILLCEHNFRDVWIRNKSVTARNWSNFAHTQTHTQPRLN